jgi:predicted methyltransferase
MLHVCTTGPLCGIVQTFGATGTGPASVASAVWVFVVRGVVGMGVGDGGNTGLDVRSSTQGQWEQLQAANGG